MMLAVAHIGGRVASGGGFFFIWPLLFLLLVGLVVLIFVGRSRRQGSWMPQARPGLTVLEERYASGDIEREEYLAKREDLASWSKKPDKKKK
jgi:putative membrane protein